MGWSETRRRWQVLRAVEAELGRQRACEDGSWALPWTAEYAEVFGDRETMVAMLRYRWNLARSAQGDYGASEAVLDDQRIRLEQRSGGVRRFLQWYDEQGRTPEDAHVAA